MGPAIGPRFAIASPRGGDGRSRGAWVAGLALLLGAAAVGTRVLQFGNMNSNWDEYAFALVGHDILQGRLPYSGIYDNKPVGLYYLFAASELVFGPTVAAIRVLALAAALAAAGLIYRTCRLLSPADPRAVAMAGAALFLGLSLANTGLSSMSELIATPCIAYANHLLVRSRRSRAHSRRLPFALGLTFGAGAQITYLFLPIAACLVLARTLLDIVQGGTAQALAVIAGRLALIAAGFGVAFGAVLVPQIVSGDITEYLALQARYIAVYGGSVPLWRYVGGILEPMAWIAPPLVIAAVLWLFAGRETAKSGAPDRDLLFVLGAGLLGALIAAVASGYFFSHYFIVALPAIVLLSMLLLARLPERVRAWGLILAMASAAVSVQQADGRMLRGILHPEIETEVADYVHSATAPAEPIFVFNESHAIYYLARRWPATRFVFPAHYMTRTFRAALGIDPATMIDEALARHPAAVILGNLLPSDFATDVRAKIVSAGYVPARRFAAGPRTIEVLRPSGQTPP